MYIGLYVKAPLYLSEFNKFRNISTDFSGGKKPIIIHHHVHEGLGVF